MRHRVHRAFWGATIALVMSGCLSSEHRSAPMVEGGAVDVSGWDFHRDGMLELNGQWAFFWDELLDPTQVEARLSGARHIEVPGGWNKFPDPAYDDGRAVGPHGHATYALKVTGLDRLNNPPESLGIIIPPIATAYRAFWIADGVVVSRDPVGSRGIVDPVVPIPQWAPVVAKLPATSAEATLIIQISNQDFWLGGIFYPAVSIHSEKPLRLWFNRLAFISILTLGVILIMALYHFCLFAMRREDHASLLFSLFCLTMFMQMAGYRHWASLLFFTEPTLTNFLIESWMMTIGAYLGLPLVIEFFARVFPDEIPRWFTRVCWWTGGGLTATAFAVGTGGGSFLTPVYTCVAVVESALLFGFLYRALCAERVGARFVLVGFAMLFAGVLYDILNAQELLEGTLIMTPFGLLGFILAQSLILSRRFALAHTQAEHLSRHLQEEVENRTQALEQKTLEAMEATHEALLSREEALQSRHRALSAKEQLEEAHRQLQEIDKQKTSFFQNVSHELRTPLTLILNPLDNQSRAQPDNNDIEVAARNARRLLRLVNQLLDFQKLEAGKKKLVLEPIDLASFVTACRDYVGASCDLKKVDFRVMMDDTDGSAITAAVVDAEIDALEKICFNFLANAMKYTPDGGSIEMRLTQLDGQARISVCDTGPGISEEDQGRLFKVFSQVGSGTQREGTGLGLALAKELAHEMNARIGVDSQLGEGSTFWVEFDLSADQDASTARHVDLWEPAFDSMLNGDGESTGAEEAGEAIGGDGALVLVIDDVTDMRRLVAGTLGKYGYRVMTASNGQAGLDIARGHRPDLIVTDWMMPGMSGPELIEQLKADPELMGIPVTLLTARSDDESRVAGTVVGADAFLGKPFDEQELSSTVRNLLALKKNEKALEKAYRELELSMERELRHTRNLLSQAEKLATLGQLVSTVGHEISNPVALVDLASDEQVDLVARHEEALMRAFGEDAETRPVVTSLLEQLDELREGLGNTKLAATRLKDLSLALRTQSRSELTLSHDVLVSDLIEECLVLVGGKTRMHWVDKELLEVPLISCYRSHIGQVITNLFSNAADALNEKATMARDAGEGLARGTIRVSTSERSEGGRGGISIVIADSGNGVPDEIRQSIFEEFFTTKPAGKGTGLGLSMSTKIVKEHEGLLMLSDDEVLGGARFELWIPIDGPRKALSDVAPIPAGESVQ